MQGHRAIPSKCGPGRRDEIRPGLWQLILGRFPTHICVLKFRHLLLVSNSAFNVETIASGPMESYLCAASTT